MLQRDDAKHEQPPMHVDGDLLAEALSQPLETRNQRDAREIEEQEQEFARARSRRERAKPAPVDMDLRIAKAVADERLFMREVLAEIIVELSEQQAEAIKDALRPLQSELAQVKVEAAEQKVTICELRLTLSEQLAGKTIDLPAFPLRSRAN